jgi:hypothetical protein
MKSRNAVSKYPAVLFVPVAIILLAFGVGIGIYWQGSQDRRAEEGLRDKTLDTYVDLLSTVLNKLAEVSESKHMAVAAKGFDTLAMIFREAANVKDLGKQRDILCAPSAKMAFMRTASLTQNADLMTSYRKVCELYDSMVDIKDGPFTALQSVLEINRVGQQTVLELIELDNAIAGDP